MNKWLLFGFLLAVLALGGCSSAPTDTSVGTQEQAFGFGHGHKQKNRCRQKHWHPAPWAHSAALCRARSIECGVLKHGWHKHYCGGCGNGEVCDDGQCVLNGCEPTGVLTAMCNDTDIELVVRDSCGTVVETLPCAYGCTVDSCNAPVCGDEVVQSGEACDDGNDVNEDDCTNACTEAACGDGIVFSDGGESCDDGNQEEGDGCSNACQTESCGDGITQPNEQCDDENDMNDDLCTNNCTSAVCGDNVIQPAVNEMCDDGNPDDTDGCVGCQLALCGDGFVYGAVEECDDGNASNTDNCTNDCLLPECGDGYAQPGEQCDDGNQISTDSCTTACENAACGDGYAQPGEQCDDGNAVDNDECTNSCQLPPFCGDGLLQGQEQCDDGNAVNEDACTNECVFAACGDGYAQPGEQCDDGNAVATDECTNGCTLPVCGDGITQPGNDEQCDDANAVNTDTCTTACENAACGDGYIQPGAGEECDNGNANPNDACDDECFLEFKTVFISSELYTGNLGGLEGADAKCQTLADAAGLTGTYMAWLSVNGVGSPSTRFTHWGGHYVTVSGIKIATGWSDLVDGTLNATITVTETGGAAPQGVTGCPGTPITVWSGTTATGIANPGAFCDGWTSTDNGGAWGRATDTGPSWSSWCFGGTCSFTSPIYCFEQ